MELRERQKKPEKLQKVLDGETEIAVSHNVASIQPDLDECK